MKKILILCFIGVLIISISYYIFINYQNKQFISGASIPVKENINVANSKDTSVYINNLEVPWEIAFLNYENMLVTERKGNLLLIRDKKIIKTYKINEVSQSGEGGLLGIAVHPNFLQNSYIYLYYTTLDNNQRKNIVSRYKLKNEELIFDKVILTDIRANIFHNAGKIEFGPDGLLYITAGDALDEPAALDINQLAGKILRVTDEGSIPEDNPFKNYVYSYGHRNPQGLTWDSEKNLWSTEHGQSGAVSGLDELNKIKIGANYGWPKFRGYQNAEGFVSPEIHSGSETWAPGDAEFFDGKIFFTGLRGQALYSYNPSNKEFKKYFENEFGRLRAITLGLDGYFYISTSNKDGRGTPNENDDKIIRVNPNILK